MSSRSAVAGAIAAVALVGILTAAPVQAASLSITCPGANTSMVDRQTLNVSDVLTITATSCDQFVIPAAAEGSAVYQGVTYGPGSTVTYSGGEVTYIPPQARMAGSEEITFFNNGVSPSGRYIIYATVTATDAPAQLWFQSVGRAPGATCDSGWNPSWEQWPNAGTGGFTCNRSILGVGGFAYPTVIGNPGVG